ncbi:circadian locomoter output cycles protein kaput [Orussus abietinus]|uniref:circadian locomoter output cycles protein kaput n=1 Tax=Orussus abietinus TaxID=222816 RepID=UPI0006253296|nr:circadian locomoter output cycles protein kaput [Orussus abietinus]
MASYIRGGSSRQSDETMDEDTDGKDDTKRKSRNLSEKKRRDQFNMLVNELGSMVSTNTRKMDKSTVLKSTILFLKNHNEIALRSGAHEIQEDWKPSFLSNEEFTHLILEALDGFIMVFSSNGRIYYASESVTSLLGYLPSELANATIYEIAYQDDQSYLYNVLLNPGIPGPKDQCNIKKESQVSFTCHIKRGDDDLQGEPIYELVQFIGYFRTDVDPEMDNLFPSNRFGGSLTSQDTNLLFVGTGRLQTPQLIHEISIVDNTKSEFTSRHSLEWKFLFLDHRAPPIIGYLPFEVLGTSGYDYYHVDDLDKVVNCHESLMQKGEGTSCHYRFLTKGQQWIWLQTRFYITYNQWNSKPEFIVCTHRVVSYIEVSKHTRKANEGQEFTEGQAMDKVPTSSKHRSQVATSSQAGVQQPVHWPSKPRSSRSSDTGSRYHGAGESNATSIQVGSQLPRNSQQIGQNSKSKPNPATDTMCGTKPTSSAPRQPSEIDSGCPTFLETSQYVAAVPVQPVVTAAFTAVSALPSSELLNQQGIVMTPAQNQIQDELQRKHEELQQLIVHQQEELRRVSEQLLIARYGILSPLLNVGVPYNANTCQQTSRCVTNASNVITHSPSASPGVQGVSVLPIPITLPVPIVPTELFSHSLPVNAMHATQGSTLSQVVPSQPQNQQQSQHQATQSTQQEGAPEMMLFQVCPQAEMMYTTMESPANSQRSNVHTRN